MNNILKPDYPLSLEMSSVENTHRIKYHRERGSDFMTCLDCGAAWHVVCCESSSGVRYYDVEEVTAGDDYCLTKEF